MQIIKLSKKTLNKELICWIGVTLFFLFSNSVKGPPASKYAFALIYIFNFAIAYYILFLFVFPNFFETQKVLFILGYAIVISLYLLIDFVHLKKILPFLGGQSARANLELLEFIKHSLIPFTFVACSSLGSYLNWRSIDQFKKAVEKEKHLLSKELIYIKEQFNSHLTFNFFNFCYGKTLRASSKAAEAIEHFNEMLRFSLKTGTNNLVFLKEESEYIENFIAIQRCLTTKIFSDFTCYVESDDNHYIIPGILSTFVENAFKHGVLNDKENPIIVSLDIENDILTFIVRNKKANKKITVSTGIGLSNVNQVLKIYYPNEHNLTIDQDDISYCSKLNLKLTTIL
jgi:two-component system LytT family sensor kinase